MFVNGSHGNAPCFSGLGSNPANKLLRHEFAGGHASTLLATEGKDTGGMAWRAINETLDYTRAGWLLALRNAHETAESGMGGGRRRTGRQS
jgi:hypothetical protein